MMDGSFVASSTKDASAKSQSWMRFLREMMRRLTGVLGTGMTAMCVGTGPVWRLSDSAGY